MIDQHPDIPEGPDSADLEAIGQACFALHARMTARLLSRAYEAAMRPSGLTVAQFGLLGTIGHGGTMSETSLAEGLGLERTTLIRNLRILTEKGSARGRVAARRCRPG
jgi:hypothetical protein